jgi:hypothetical protein
MAMNDNVPLSEEQALHIIRHDVEDIEELLGARSYNAYDFASYIALDEIRDSVGSPSDAEALTGDGAVIALLKGLRALLSGSGEIGLNGWEFLEGTYLSYPSSYSVYCPSYSFAVILEVEYGKCYYEINGVSASPTSHGYIPEDGMRSIGPITNASSLYVHGPSAVVHMQYWREA